MIDMSGAVPKWEPNWAVRPGVLLKEHIEARGLSAAAFAALAGLAPELVGGIIDGTNPVTGETALRLEHVLGLKAYIWMGAQANWERFQSSPRAGAAE